MKKHWLGLAALVLVTAGVSSGATAFYLSSKYHAREQAILAQAKLQTTPVPMPVWILQRLAKGFQSTGSGCGGLRGSAAGDEAAPCDSAAKGFGVGIPTAKASR